MVCSIDGAELKRGLFLPACLLPCSLSLPRSVDLEGGEVLDFAFVHVVFHEAVDAGAARAAAKTGTKLGEVGGVTGGNNFHVAVFGVAHPAAQLKFTRLTLHKPAKAYTLHPPLN
jgi:hypothetical protein